MFGEFFFEEKEVVEPLPNIQRSHQIKLQIKAYKKRRRVHVYNEGNIKA